MRRGGGREMLALVVAIAVGVGAGAVEMGCRDDAALQAEQLTGGRVDEGKLAIEAHGCGSCHEIPGIRNARAKVGPSLDGIASRSYLAGKLTNSPESMIQWVRHPQEVEPGNAMPDLGINDEVARDIAAYLYTLR